MKVAQGVVEIETREQFDEITKSNDKVLVKLWAPWCGPCRMLAPVVVKVANRTEDNTVVVSVNVDTHPDITKELGVSAIPFMAVYVNGVVRDRIEGAAQREDDILETINK